MQTKYTIYKATNMVNGKCYIGFDSKWPKRKHEHCIIAFNKKSPSYNYLFHKAIRKYGVEAFQWEVVYEHKDKNHTLTNLEPQFIIEHNSYYLTGHGYNMTHGGEGAIGYRHPRAMKNKEILLALPPGSPRPNSNTTALGRALRSYIKQGITAHSYDAEFDKEIRIKQPEWFVDHVDEKMNELLSMTLDSARPDRYSELGRALASYTNPSSNSWNKEFTIEIKKAHPDWFQGTAKENQEILLTMPPELPRPNSKKSTLGRALCDYINPSRINYSEEFTKAIKEKQPQWFANTANEHKDALIALPVNSPRPSRNKSKHGKYLITYTNKTYPSTYDPEFDAKIRAKQPQWWK